MENKPSEMKQYVQGAGACMVTKSLLEHTSNLRWMFKEERGWVAFGHSDTQEYVDNASNFAIVDFNTLANIEPTVMYVLYMPVGTDLEFRMDDSGKYFVDTKSGKEIREPIKQPGQIAFEKNLKFLNQETYEPTFFKELFEKSDGMEPFIVGKTDFPSGEVVLADPLVYLGSEYATTLEKKIPAGCYEVELAICHSSIVGPRVVAAKLVVGDTPAIRYEIATAKEKMNTDSGKTDAWTIFGVDAGVACFSDEVMAKQFKDFKSEWYQKNPGKNLYDDYFAHLFQESYEKHPAIQRQGGDFIHWEMHGTTMTLCIFASGMGDGIYSAYWGYDVDGNVAELVIPFMNPAYF